MANKFKKLGASATVKHVDLYTWIIEISLIKKLIVKWVLYKLVHAFVSTHSTPFFQCWGGGGAKFCVCMQINMFMVVAYYRYDNIYFLSQN